jgi:hypothetical protein
MVEVVQGAGHREQGAQGTGNREQGAGRRAQGAQGTGNRAQGVERGLQGKGTTARIPSWEGQGVGSL